MRPKQIVDGKVYCVDCKDWRPVEEFRKKPDGHFVSYCREHQDIRLRDSYRRRAERRRTEQKQAQPLQLPGELHFEFGYNYPAGGFAISAPGDIWMQ
jgi:hypothetical protein